MKKKYMGWLCAWILAGGLAGCGKTIPGDIIQPEAMEPLLYDYHLATTLSSDLPYSENYKKEGYLNYVFQKHGVTEAEFDSSMVWYARHTDRLTAIYDNLQKRFEAEGKQVRKFADRRSGQTSLTISRDTVDIANLYWLSASALTNKLTFELKADTSFRQHDALVWTADFKFFPERQEGANAVMGLNFTFENDSTQGVTRMVTASGTQQLMLKADSAFTFKTVHGFIYYAGGEENGGSVLIHDIHLIRHHDAGTSLEPVEESGKAMTPKMR